MRLLRSSWLLGVVCIASCLSPWHCDHEAAMDLGAPPPPYDLAVGEAGRPAGNVCATLDNCNRNVADTCNGRCQCGSEHPCDSGLACCGGQCVDLFTDRANCGGCGIACGDGQCVRPDGGAPHCTCDADGGIGCASPLEPACNADGVCSCGPSSIGVCGPRVADSCGAGGCMCGGEPACGGTLVDHCDPGRGCRCGSEPACDPKLATGCDPTATDTPCRCAQGPSCQPGTFCCTQNSTCCQPSQYCCLNGCCAHPCLLFGFCDH